MGITIICDTRQQANKHSNKDGWWERNGVSTFVSKVPFGDYVLPPKVSVDTKRNIQELAQNIDQQHDRFRRECVAARDAGCLLVILTENEDGVRSLADLAEWTESQEAFAKRKNAVRRIEGSRLAKACATMSERYGVRFEFCHPSEAAARIMEILTKGCAGNGEDA